MNWFRRRQEGSHRPLVSGILVTTRRDRHPFAELAVESFLSQDWPHLQLVVFNGTQVPLKRHKRVRELSLRPMSVPQMRNIARHNADGMYCALLHDDTWYHRTFLPVMMQNIGSESLHLLRYKQVCSVKERRAHLIEDDRLFCPVWRRTHPAQFAEDDAQFVSQFYNVQRIEAPSELAIRFVS